MPKKSDEVISTRLRLPAGLHRMITASAKRNNRSVNSEMLWGLAHYLGGEAPKFVEHMAVEQRRLVHDVLLALIKDPAQAAQAIANIEKEMDDVGEMKSKAKGKSDAS
jgi:hypothetical protein